jgi:fatty-acyl-CoA synthase
VLSRFPAFAGVAVYAVPDVETGAGDLVMLAAELRESAVFDPAAFARWLDEQPDLGTKWAPSYVRLCESLDETATGKITKVRLKAEGWRSADPIFVRPSRSTAYERLTPEMADELDQRLADR